MTTQLQTSTQDGVTVVRVTGELTQEGVPVVESQFNAAAGAARSGLVVDLSGLRLITTPGIAMLLAANEQMHARGLKLIFCGLKGSVAEVLLERCRLDLVLTIAPSVETAVAAAGQ